MADIAQPAEPARCVVGVGASAGGVEALLRLVEALPGDLPAAVLVVLHISAGAPSVLPQILARVTDMPVRAAVDGEPLLERQILVAPSDRHLVARTGHVHVRRGPKENGMRPAVDPMLRSIARLYRARAVAVVLSGALDDGSGGARAVAAAGGTVFVQDPAEAMVAGMPQNAREAVGEAARVLPVGDIAREVAQVAAEVAREQEESMANSETSIGEPPRPQGPPTGFTCPECNGALWAVEEEDGSSRYQCRVGHAYSEQAFVGAQGDRVEAALWTALEVLEERAELLERIADRHVTTRPQTSRRMRDAVADAHERAALLREALSAGAAERDALDVDAEDVLP